MSSTPLSYHLADSPDYDDITDMVISGLGSTLGKTAERVKQNSGREKTLSALANLSELYEHQYDSSPIMAKDHAFPTYNSDSIEVSDENLEDITDAVEQSQARITGE